MRSRAPLFALLLTVSYLALPLAAHAGIPFLGPIIPQDGNQAVCPASWGMVLIVINNIISFALTLAIVFVAPLCIGYAGFLWVLAPTSSSNVSKARGVLLNTVAGLVIAFAGWMIVDAVMAVLYNPSAAGGTWSDLIGSGGINPCLPQEGALPGDTLNQAVVSLPDIAAIPDTTTGVPLSTGTGACDASALKQAVPSLTSTQANTLACIAQPESVCGSKMTNYSWNKDTGNGKASTAYGAFQVTLSGNHVCFENAACYAAAGVQGPLNCQNGFNPQGFTSGGNPTVLANCTRAAANLACNAAAAACVLQKQGYGAWTGDPSGAAAQKACIAKYANT